jgi:glycosyltransferase involved in cell wall biosynthesis
MLLDDSLPVVKRVLVAVASDIVTDMRVTKVVRFLHSRGFAVKVICCKKSTVSWTNEFEVLRLRMLFHRSILFYFFFNLKLLFYGLFERADVILSNDLDTLPACRILGWLKRVPVVYDSHEFFTESVGLMNRPFTKKVWLFIENIFLPGVAGAYTVSQPISSAYADRYKMPFAVIRNYPELSNFPDKKNVSPFSKGKFILYQGVFNPSRSLSQLIEAMQWVSEEYHLVLIGHGELEVELREKVDLLNLNHRVTFTGSLLYADMIQYTYFASLGIALEESSSLSFLHSLPNKVFDYVAAGLPFISLGTPLVREQIEKYDIGILAESNEPNSLARRINAVLADAQLLERIRAAQHRARVHFNWENECRNLEQLFFGLK